MADGGSNLGIAFGVSRAPDGSVWVSITVQTAATSFTWGVPHDKAEEFITAFVNNFRGMAKQARREASGLKVVEKEALYKTDGSRLL